MAMKQTQEQFTAFASNLRRLKPQLVELQTTLQLELSQVSDLLLYLEDGELTESTPDLSDSLLAGRRRRATSPTVQ